MMGPKLRGAARASFHSLWDMGASRASKAAGGPHRGHVRGLATASSPLASPSLGWRSGGRGRREGCAASRRGYEARGEAWEHCRNIMQKRDLGNLMCLAFLPKGVRSACMAIRAFNAEVASAADKVKDPRMAEMRLQWWTQALLKLREKNPPEHPVAEALCGVIHEYHMDVRLLDAIVEWRIKDLYSKQPETIDSLELYAEGTQTNMAFLTLQCMGVFDNEPTQIAASHVGQALGLALLLKGTRAHAHNNRCYIPKALTQAHKLQLGTLAKGEPSQALSQCVYEVAMEAKRHLELAHEANPPRQAIPALMPAAIAELYLEDLEKYEYDIMNPYFQPQTQSHIPLQLRLLKNSFTGRF